MKTPYQWPVPKKRQAANRLHWVTGEEYKDIVPDLPLLAFCSRPCNLTMSQPRQREHIHIILLYHRVCNIKCIHLDSATINPNLTLGLEFSPTLKVDLNSYAMYPTHWYWWAPRYIIHKLKQLEGIHIAVLVQLPHKGVKCFLKKLDLLLSTTYREWIELTSYLQDFARFKRSCIIFCVEDKGLVCL